MDNIVFVGLDVRKATIAVAIAEGARGGEVRNLGNFLNRPDHIAKLVERLAKGGRSLSFCYEAWPCGFGLYRQLIGLGHECMVVAPSLIPMKPGDRVKTDRRDAVMLAKHHPAGELHAIRVIVNDALSDLAADFSSLYSRTGRPERLLRAMLLQAFYSVRSERQLMEWLDTDLLFRWFVGATHRSQHNDASAASCRDGWTRREIRLVFIFG